MLEQLGNPNFIDYIHDTGHDLSILIMLFSVLQNTSWQQNTEVSNDNE